MTTTSCMRSKSRDLAARLTGVALVMAAAWAAPARAQYAAPAAGGAEAVFPDKTVVSLEVARNEPERSRGLMYRTSMPERAGMIFLFERPGVYPFWMKNTLIPLDMIFIARDLTVAGVVHDAQPGSERLHRGGALSLYVLEVNAGWAAEHRISRGSAVRFENLRL